MPQTLNSIGHMCVLAQRPISEVEQIVKDCGAEPVLVLNGLAYYDAQVCGTVLCRVNGWTDQAAYHRRFDVQEIHGDA